MQQQSSAGAGVNWLSYALAEAGAALGAEGGGPTAFPEAPLREYKSGSAQPAHVVLAKVVRAQLSAACVAAAAVVEGASTAVEQPSVQQSLRPPPELPLPPPKMPPHAKPSPLLQHAFPQSALPQPKSMLQLQPRSAESRPSVEWGNGGVFIAAAPSVNQHGTSFAGIRVSSSSDVLATQSVPWPKPVPPSRTASLPSPGLPSPSMTPRRDRERPQEHEMLRHQAEARRSRSAQQTSPVQPPAQAAAEVAPSIAPDAEKPFCQLSTTGGASAAAALARPLASVAQLDRKATTTVADIEPNSRRLRAKSRKPERPPLLDSGLLLSTGHSAVSAATVAAPAAGKGTVACRNAGNGGRTANITGVCSTATEAVLEKSISRLSALLASKVASVSAATGDCPLIATTPSLERPVPSTAEPLLNHTPAVVRRPLPSIQTSPTKTVPSSTQSREAATAAAASSLRYGRKTASAAGHVVTDPLGRPAPPVVFITHGHSATMAAISAGKIGNPRHGHSHRRVKHKSGSTSSGHSHSSSDYGSSACGDRHGHRRGRDRRQRGGESISSTISRSTSPGASVIGASSASSSSSSTSSSNSSSRSSAGRQQRHRKARRHFMRRHRSQRRRMPPVRPHFDDGDKAEGNHRHGAARGLVRQLQHAARADSSVRGAEMSIGVGLRAPRPLPDAMTSPAQPPWLLAHAAEAWLPLTKEPQGGREIASAPPQLGNSGAATPYSPPSASWSHGLASAHISLADVIHRTRELAKASAPSRVQPAPHHAALPTGDVCSTEPSLRKNFGSGDTHGGRHGSSASSVFDKDRKDEKVRLLGDEVAQMLPLSSSRAMPEPTGERVVADHADTVATEAAPAAAPKARLRKNEAPLQHNNAHI